MRYQIFTVLDKAVNAFLPPFQARARGEAIRQFADASNNPEHMFHRHLDDYVLFSLGEWDDASGLYYAGEPTRVVSAREVLVPTDPFTPETQVRGNGANGRVTL